MNTRAIIEMTKGRWREFRREPSAFFFVLLMPAIWMILLGLAFSGDRQEHFHVGILPSLKQSNVAVVALSSSPLVTVVSGSKVELQTKLRKSAIAIVVGKAQGSDITDPHANYQLIYDPSHPESKAGARLVSDIIQTAHGRSSPVIIETNKTAAAGRYIDFLIPGLLALSLLTTSLFGTGMTIVVNRRENLLKRYLVTPMRSYEYIISHILGRYMIVCVEIAAVLGAGFLLFGFKVGPGWLDFLILAALGTATFTALGILCGSRGRNSSAYNGMVNLIVLPMMILGGIWFSKTHFPIWVAEIAAYLPLTALVDGMRSITLEGASLSNLGFELGVLAAYALGAGLIAAKTFKWQ